MDFIIAPSATLVTSRLAGADTIMVSTNLPLFIDHIVSLDDIRTVEQLKGKTGGVNRLGTTSDMTLRLALRRLGVDPEKETKIIATGENPQRLAALSRNITQFTLLGEPLVREAEKMGFRDLIDIGTLKIPYHVNAVVTREKTVKERRSLIAKVMRAFTEALQQAGYIVASVADPAQTAAEAARVAPALIIARLGDPMGDGFTLCRELRGAPDTRDIPLLVLMRFDDLYTREQIVRAGATSILIEPLRRTLLLRQVRRLLARGARTGQSRSMSWSAGALTVSRPAS